MTTTETRPTWAYPDARLLLRADVQRDDHSAWLDARRAGIGGSDTPALLGESDYQSRYGLWLDKTGQAEAFIGNNATQRGNWLEPHLAGWFTEQTGIDVRRCGMLAHREQDWLRTNVDRLTADGGDLEIKTHSVYAAAAKEWRDGGISRAAYVQGQQQLAVTGRSHVWFVAFIDPAPVLRGPVERDEQLIARITAEAERFWHEHVLPGVPPEVDLATLTDDEIALRWPVEVTGSTAEAEFPAHVAAMLAERAECKAAISAGEKRAKEIDAALRAMTGDAEALTVDGRPVLTLKSQANNPSVDKKLAAEHPDIWDRYVRQSTSRRIRICKQKENAA